MAVTTCQRRKRNTAWQRKEERTARQLLIEDESIDRSSLNLAFQHQVSSVLLPFSAWQFIAGQGSKKKGMLEG